MEFCFSISSLTHLRSLCPVLKSRPIVTVSNDQKQYQHIPKLLIL